VFWYGIEKLFMQSIGLDAVSVGMLTVLTIVLNLALDIPSGILADKWSRKGMLVVSAFALAICSLLLGSSTGFATYAIGYALYSLYVVCTSGTYQAITYDSLHEEGESKFYSKVMGRAYALFLCGAGVANIASGFIADNFGYRMPFYLTVLSCLVNMAVMLSLKEPAFHKPENKEKILRQLIKTSKAVLVIPLLRILAIIMSLFAIVELFKADFGQLYFLRYVTEPQLLGLLWAVYAFTWAIKNKHMYKKLVVGPNLVITPKDHNAIITNDAIDIILQPSLWTKQFLLSFEPRLEHKIKLWPAGVEIPKESTLQKTIDVLIYSKNKMKYKLLETICNELKQKQLTYTILEYGSFKQATYFKKLNEAKMLIYLSNSESQGLALQEAWARDIPTLVFNRGYYEYKGNHFVNEHISAPYLNNMTGTFFNEETFSTQFPFFLNNLDRFTPKKYVEQNLSDRVCAEKFLDTVLAS
jgi:hypothetical protein